MTRAISRDSFNELKQYLGVHLQQGRVILDSDWNEGQDIMANLVRRLGQDAFGDGVLDEGFEILPMIPPGAGGPNDLVYLQAGLPLLFRFPLAAPFDAFESLDGWALSGPGKLRLSKDQPYEGTSFLRVSDHTGRVEVARTLTAAVDLSAFQFAHFRFRVNQAVPFGSSDIATFFVEDASGNRNVYPIRAVPSAQDRWTPGAALPLDLHFDIFDFELGPAVLNRVYRTSFMPVGATSSVSWAKTAGAFPPGLTLIPFSFNARYAQLDGTPTQSGTFSFTLTATMGATSKSRAFTLRVQAPPASSQDPNTADNSALSWDGILQQITTPSGTPANLTQIKKYGFQIFQQSPAPLVWDFDALYLASRDMIRQAAVNNFIISGPQQKQVLDLLQSQAQSQGIPEVINGPDLLNGLLERTFHGVPRAYTGGLASTQTRDLLYSEQADPGDPPLAAPVGAVRKDLVYLDVWLEPVTYVEDPDLREIALGGPDTATRMQLRQRVRVAQGGTLPTDDGMGTGTLATEGSYTDRANRLYLVEIDTAGGLGAATLRWSEDNGSTIQRVIEAVPPGATKLRVEDASAFQPGDFILLRKEFTHEEHRIAGISGNTITLQEPTGSSVTFALADRPKIQRWNAFRVPIAPDANDSTVSGAIPLSHGVAIRFGGGAMKRGDRWAFRARYLAGDDAAGISSTTRIETLSFELPQGTKHYYAPLAALIRDPAGHEPDRVEVVSDRRRRAGRIVHYQSSVDSSLFTGTFVGGDISLGTTSAQSTFVFLYTGFNNLLVNIQLRLKVEFFNGDDALVYAQDAVVVAASDSDGETIGMAIASPFDLRTLDLEFVTARARFDLPAGVTGAVGGQFEIFEIRNHINFAQDLT